MITYVNGDIFQSPAKVLVNPVNTEGVMGKGLAKQFKSYFPDMFPRYQDVCEKGLLQPGKLWIFKTQNKWVLNFPTKTTWRKPSRIEYLEKGLQKFVETYDRVGITSVAFPKIGCGNGELNWDKQVSPLMSKYLSNIPIDVFIHLHDVSPGEKPEHVSAAEMKKWLVTQPNLLAFEEVKLDLITSIMKNPTYTNPIDRTSFSVVLNKQDGRLEFSDGSVLPFELLREIWGTIRRYGYLSRDVAHYSINKFYGEVLGLLTSLEYCKLVNVSTHYNEFLAGDARSLGLQLVPESFDQLYSDLPLSVSEVRNVASKD